MTEYTVTKAGEQTPAEPTQILAAPTSPLFNLRQVRAQKLAGLFLDLKVPRWDEDGGPSIWVRYGPIDPDHAIKVSDKRYGNDHALLLSNADMLVSACLGVYCKVDDKRYSLRPDDAEGSWTKFDPDLARQLGLEGSTRAVDVVQGLYLAPGDLMNAAIALGNWSAQQSEQGDKAALGE